MNKKFLIWLRKECEKLPEKTYKAAHRYFQPILIEDPKEGEPKWMRGYIEDHKVNHYRRCKRMFKKYGIKAIHAYFYIVGGMIPQKEM
jgi:hypothetical protein